MQRKVLFTSWKLPVLVAVIALLASLAVAACGGEEPATSAPTTAATELPAPTSTPHPTDDPPPTVRPTATDTPAPTAMPEPTAVPAPTASAAPQATEAPEPTEAPTATATPEPTAAPEPTATPEPATTPEPTATPAPAATPLPPCEGNRGGQVGDCAPEFAGTQEWINSEPLTMESLRGKVVLIDFWTYSCINCIRTLPFLREWYDRYADEGLVIVGVHTPEFEFEKLYDNVVQATKDEMVAWPVVQDNGFSVWRSYANRYWPAKYLVDQHGVIQYRHFGEGRYAETEEMIRSLLAEAGAESDAFAMPLPADQQRLAPAATGGSGQQTRELFAGWNFVFPHYQAGRGVYVGQVETYTEAALASESAGGSPAVGEFQVPESVWPDRIYFHGPWAIGPESARHSETTEDLSHFILLGFTARSVNAVLTSESGKPYKVVVTVNNEYLTEDNKGEDIIIGEGGESYLMVTEPRAYKLVELPGVEQGQFLQMFSMSDDFGLYSFTFGSYEDGF